MVDNPFPGPLPYRAADRGRFYGRDDLSRALQDSVLAHRCVTVYGPRGAGKSSILQASALPALVEAEEVRVARVEAWPAAVSPACWLTSTMHRDLGLGDPPPDQPPEAAVLLAAQRAARRSARLLVVSLDHLEQLFYPGRSPEQAAALFDCIDQLVEQPLRNVRVVLLLREDYLGRFLDALRYRRWPLEHGLRVGPLTVGDLSAAVCRAAAAATRPQTWSPEEVRGLMLQARAPGQEATDDAEVTLISAQAVCRTLFEQRARGAMTEATTITGLFSVDNLDSRSAALLGLGPEPAQAPPELAALLRQPYSLVLGDAGEDRAALLQRLERFLCEQSEGPEEGASFRELVEQGLTQPGEDALHQLLERTLAASPGAPPPPFVDALARFVPPGVHLSLLWEPRLARDLSRAQPSRDIYLVAPPLHREGDTPRVLRRAAGAAAWTVEPGMPPRLDLDRDIVVLRLYGGYSTKPRPAFVEPSSAEDSLVRDTLGAEGRRPPAWMDALVDPCRSRPALFLGLTMLDWRHRALLRWLYDERPAPGGSLALLPRGAQDDEADLWERGAGLPGGERIRTLIDVPSQLKPLLDTFSPDGSRR